MDAKNLKASWGNVVVVDTEVAKVSKGGILLPEVSKDPGKIVTGNIWSLAPFLLESGALMDTEFKTGDLVAYGQYAGAGSAFKNDADGLTYRIIKWTEILCKYNGAL